MKFGMLWFLHFDFFLKILRWAVAVFFILGLTVPILGSLFVVSWVLFAVCFLITMSTLFIHFPSNEKILNFISNFEREFQETLKNEFRNYSKVKVTTLQCFAVGKKRSLSRWIGKKKIYSNLVVLAWIETMDEVWFVCNERSLCHDRPAIITKYSLDSMDEIKSEKTSEDDADMVIWSLHIADEDLTFCCKDDYHLREFLSCGETLKRSFHHLRG